MIDQDLYEELEKVNNYFTLADKQLCKVNGRIYQNVAAKFIFTIKFINLNIIYLD